MSSDNDPDNKPPLWLWVLISCFVLMYLGMFVAMEWK